MAPIPAPIVERLQAALVRQRPPAGPQQLLQHLAGAVGAPVAPQQAGVIHGFGPGGTFTGSPQPQPPAGPSGVEDLASHIAALRNAVHMAGTGQPAANPASGPEDIFGQMQALRHSMQVAGAAGHPHHHAQGPAGLAEDAYGQIHGIEHAMQVVGGHQHIPHGGSGLSYRPPRRKGGGIAQAAAAFHAV